MSNSRIIGNRSSGNEGGGLFGSFLTVVSSEIRNNIANRGGGTHAVRLTMQDTEVTRNLGGGPGEAVSGQFEEGNSGQANAEFQVTLRGSSTVTLTDTDGATAGDVSVT